MLLIYLKLPVPFQILLFYDSIGNSFSKNRTYMQRRNEVVREDVESFV